MGSFAVVIGVEILGIVALFSRRVFVSFPFFRWDFLFRTSNLLFISLMGCK